MVCNRSIVLLPQQLFHRRTEQVQNAWSFDRLRTMRSHGMRPWLKLMADRRLAEFVAERHRYEREARRALAAMAR